jgi:hypothetical protein
MYLNKLQPFPIHKASADKYSVVQATKWVSTSSNHGRSEKNLHCFAGDQTSLILAIACHFTDWVVMTNKL